jgi:hypothetical protein
MGASESDVKSSVAVESNLALMASPCGRHRMAPATLTQITAGSNAIFEAFYGSQSR